MMKSSFNKKILSFVFVVTIFSLSFCCVDKVSASEEYVSKVCEYTDEYIAWSKLSDEEKAKTQMPSMCDLNGAPNNKLQSDVKKTFDAFNLVKLPAKYDIRTTNYKGTIRDQMSTGSCWAFSTATISEIYAKKNMSIEQVYSARHIEYSTSISFLEGSNVNEWAFNREVGDGGTIFNSSAYLISNLGPILEEDMPFEDNEDDISISEIKNKDVQLDVNGVLLEGASYAPCSSAALLTIKEEVQNSGAVYSSVYFSGLEEYYNEETAALYYSGEEYSNHAVTIVGWDDTYSASNFSELNKPAGNGAWIVQNSWGEEFGDNGYNYVSYYDERICSVYMSIKDADSEVEDNAYIYDKLGHNTAVGYGTYSGEMNDYGYGLSVYEKGNDTEVLKEVTIGTVDVGSYKIYYAPGDASSSSISDMTLIGEGSIDYGGYLTHKLDNPVYLDESVEKFSIAVFWKVDSETYPIPTCSTNDILYFNLNAVSGQTYTSADGYYWYDAYEDNWIVSIKAFTNDVNYEISTQVEAVSKSNDDSINVDLSFNTENIVKDDLSLVVVDSNDNVIDDFTISYELDVNDLPASAKLKFANGLDNGTYYINVYYQNNFIESVDFTVLFGIISDVYTVSSTSKTIYVSSPVIVSTFLSNLEGYEGGVTSSGNSVTSGYVGTGMKLDDYVIILKGDVTGDGQIKVNDVMKISKYTVEGTGLENSYFKMAADVTGDQLVKVNDVMKISKYTVEGGTL